MASVEFDGGLILCRDGQRERGEVCLAQQANRFIHQHCGEPLPAVCRRDADLRHVGGVFANA